jgi:signal transduction histidine kinase
VLRHSPGASASVSVVYEQRCLVVTIEDDGATDGSEPSSEGCGYGLVGMRERAEALGGDVHAGPTAAGGFRILATLPFLPRQ